jgi:3-deoxy-D-manno-octulosonate 8-phosphate phosphatase (KDO 8-P phosphatase)
MNKNKEVLPKLLITDIDGVWTDGGVYVNESGIESKRFCISDGWGAFLLNKNNILWAIITGERSEIVRHRAKKLGCPLIFTGIHHKGEVVAQLMKDYNLTAEEVVFLGDDLNDLTVFSLGIRFYCPADANPLIKKMAHQTLESAGGDGCFREFVNRFFPEEDYLHELMPSSST